MDFFDFLLKVSKPTRYAGHEWNSLCKEWDQVNLRVALAYPDLYEVGMSNLALKILYGILNNRTDILAERVFNPWPDAEQKMRQAQLPLFSLESRKPIRAFDIFGFTLPYELCYTNILNMLDLAGLPFLAIERDESFPLIIGGGPGAFNPEPIADFFDLFVLGDGEDVILELADLQIQAKKEGWTRAFTLQKMAGLTGVYVPAHFSISYHPEGTINRITPLYEKQEVAKRIVENLDQAYYPTNPVISHAETIHDRFALEIARGCSRGCRFCQAGYIYRPVRERSINTLQTMAKESIHFTGYDELSLVSLSSSDYSGLEQLLTLLRKDCCKHTLALSLPSLRPGTLTSSIISLMKEVRKTGFTIAPEAGTQRLRQVINKGITDQDILSTARQIFEHGWDLLKLYFMIGLPTEQESDLEQIVYLSKEILKIGRSLCRRRPNINLTISPFVPKPHTPFQRNPQDHMDILRAKETFLAQRLKERSFAVKCRNPEVSCLEAAFARGDRRLSKVLVSAWKLGSRFDQWSEQFSFSLWEQAFAEHDLKLSFYANRSITEEEILPWNHLLSGVSAQFLSAEAQKAWQEEPTPDCRLVSCHGCGACQDKGYTIPALPSQVVASMTSSPLQDNSTTITDSSPCPNPPNSCHSPNPSHSNSPNSNSNPNPNPSPNLPSHSHSQGREKNGEQVCQIRARFHKKGFASCMSHLDLMRGLNRTIRRAGLPISFTQGFHPHPKIAFGPPLPVGVEGWNEYADFIFRESVSLEDFLIKINQQLPEGLAVSAAKYIPLKARSLFQVINCARYHLTLGPQTLSPFSKSLDHERLVTNFLAQEDILVQKGKKSSQEEKGLNIRPLIIGLNLLEDSLINEHQGLSLTLSIGQESVNPRQVLSLLYQGAAEDVAEIPWKISRQGLYVNLSDHLYDPMEII